MSHELHLILNVAVAVTVALAGGLLAHRLRQPVIVGYLLAGMAIGPFTPGFIGDREEIAALAEVGVIFLMFALDIEFSLKELARVRGVALVGTALQGAAVQRRRHRAGGGARLAARAGALLRRGHRHQQHDGHPQDVARPRRVRRWTRPRPPRHADRAGPWGAPDRRGAARLGRDARDGAQRPARLVRLEVEAVLRRAGVTVAIAPERPGGERPYRDDGGAVEPARA